MMGKRLRFTGVAWLSGMLLWIMMDAAVARTDYNSSPRSLPAPTFLDILAHSGQRFEHDASLSASRLGQKLFVQRCAACHGQDGRGGMGPDLRPISSRQHIKRREIIEKGRKTKGMPSYKGQFSEAEWRALLDHITRLSKPVGIRSGANQGHESQSLRHRVTNMASDG